MTNLVVIDTSVAFKWFHTDGEESVDVALHLLDSHEAGSILLAAPANLHAELANSLRYTRLDPAIVAAMVEGLDKYHVELFPSTSDRLEAAVRLSYLHRISVYDALFLQLASELGCPLVTADCRAFANIDTPVEIRLL